MPVLVFRLVLLGLKTGWLSLMAGWLAGPQAWLTGAQAWLDGHEGGWTNKWMDGR